MTSMQRNLETSEPPQSSDAEHHTSKMKASDPSLRPDNGVKEQFHDIQKSQNDKRDYRGLVLKNDMKVLLISDPATDKSAASLVVNIGFLSDPDDLPGLAHFCEHMLFLGTEKYPDEDAFNSFLSQHTGSTNASTHADYTNYYMDVAPKFLDDALDRLAQFFLKPLFTESATERELNAVNSEFERNVTLDIWRAVQLDKHHADPEHPFSKFGVGNKLTLDTVPKSKGIDVRKALLEFHDTWYSANIMALSVLGKESLDELERMVVDRFAHVENKNIEAPSWQTHPYRDEHFRTMCYVVPLKDFRQMNIVFWLPDMRKHYKSAPWHYVAHLIGHEGEGSLLARLRKLGWSTFLSAGDSTYARGECNFFNINIDLTEDGMKHVDDIIKLLFQYINMLKQDGPLEWIFEEYTQMSRLNFNFKEQSPARSYVHTTVQALQKYPMEEVLIAPCVFKEWRPDLVKQVIDCLTPDKIRIYVHAKAFEDIAMETEKWYGTKYKKNPIPAETLDEWRNAGINPELRCPAKNEFIPMDLTIRANESSASSIDKFPVIIEDTPFMRVWFKQDNEFLVPKANASFDFISPLAYSDPLNCILTYMYVQLVKDSLQEYTYNANLAGLLWDLNSGRYGITLVVGGYNDKHQTLLEKVMDKMVNFTIDPQRFDILKENYVRGLKNLDNEQPYQRAVYYTGVLLTDPLWPTEDLLNATPHLTMDKLREFVPLFLTKIHTECLVHGNLTKAEALKTVHLVESKLQEPSRDSDNRRTIIPLLPRQLLLHREINLDNGSHYVYKKETKHHKLSCVVVYYETGLLSTEANVHLELLSEILSQPCFNTLRTQEQLGYIVFCGVRRSNGVQGLRVIVQGDRHPEYFDHRIGVFMDSMSEKLNDMSDESFDRYKTSLASLRLEKPKRLSMLSAVFWSEISSQQYNFDRANIEVAYLMTITKDVIVNFFKEYVNEKSSTRRKMAVHVVSIGEGGAGATEETEETKKAKELLKDAVEIKDINTFKASQSLYPLLEPFNGIPRKGQRSKL